MDDNQIPVVDSVKLFKLQKNFEIIAEMSKIIVDLHDRKYRDIKKNLELFENEVEQFTGDKFETKKQSLNIRDIFFNEVFPIFVKNMNMFVTFKEDLKNNKSKDFLSVLNIPFLVKMTTKNMILHLIMLTNYKSLVYDATLKIKDVYNREISVLFNNLDFNCLLIEIDKEISTNLMINSAKKNSDNFEFTNLKKVYEDVFKHINSSFENQKFSEIFRTVSDLTQDLKNMITAKKTQDTKEFIKLNDNEIDLTNLSYFQMNEQESNQMNIFKIISSQDLYGNGKNESTLGRGRKRKINKRNTDDNDNDTVDSEEDDAATDEDQDDLENLEDMEDIEDIKVSGEMDILNQSNKKYDFETKNPEYLNKVDLTLLFEKLKTRLNKIQEIYYSNNNNYNTKESKRLKKKLWLDIRLIYKKFDKILDKLINDTNKLRIEYFSPDDSNAELNEYFKKINNENLFKYITLENNLDVAQTSILSALPFQASLNSNIKECLITIQKYLQEYELVERKLISNKIMISSLVKYQLHSIKGSNAIFPIINFLPFDIFDQFTNLIQNLNIESMIEFFKTTEENGYFLSICGFVCTPIEKLILVCESKEIKLFDNTNMIKKLEDSYVDTIKNLFLFLEMFTFQMKKQSKQPEFKSAFFLNLSKNVVKNNFLNNYKKRSIYEDEFKNDKKKKKEITTTSQEYVDYPFSYLKCISSTFHAAVSNLPQFKHALLLIQSFFSMIEPIFIITCLLRKNEQFLLEIINFFVHQTTYEYKDQTRLDKNEIPLLLEAFLIRFLIFYLFLNVDLKLNTFTTETLNLTCMNVELIKIFNNLKNKNRIMEKLGNFGITLTYDTSTKNVVINFEMKSLQSVSTSYTIKDEYFTACANSDQHIPDVLSFIQPNISSIDLLNNNNDSDKLSKNYQQNDVLKCYDCLRILQQLDSNIFGGICLQSLKMVECNYNLNNLKFSEQNISITIN
jgi:hypothetical protein